VTASGEEEYRRAAYADQQRSRYDASEEPGGTTSPRGLLSAGITRRRTQGQGQIVGRLKPLARALRQAGPEDAPQLRPDMLARLRRVRRFVMEDRRHGLCGGVAAEGSPAGHHLVQDAAEGKEVAAGVHRLAADLFRRHVAYGAHHRTSVSLRRDVRAGF